MMCGIFGAVEFDQPSSRDHLDQCLGTLVHRGPDAGAMELWKRDSCQIAFGHRRLSILELSPLGAQPMTWGGNTIVFNGEVYNFEEIKQVLAGLGVVSESHSDTAVILRSYAQWGIQSIHKFVGMFSFGLLDPARNKLYLVRDRAGVKPLYYRFENGNLVFASEIKAIHRYLGGRVELDPESVELYTRYGYIPGKRTIYKSVHKVLPGHYLEIDLSTRTMKEVEWWSALSAWNLPPVTGTPDSMKEELTHLLESACKYRMVADVPVGVFLSGGYDSTLVTALLQKGALQPLRTFTIGFEEKQFNEAPHAAAVARHLGTNHTEYICTQKEALDIVPSLPDIFDEPLADNSVLPTILVSRVARSSVAVALSADAGDELFAGYGRYPATLSMWRSIRRMPFGMRKGIAAILDRSGLDKSFLGGAFYNFEARCQKIADSLRATTPLDILGSSVALFGSASSVLNRGFHMNDRSGEWDLYSPSIPFEGRELDTLMASEYRNYMVDDILVKVDRAAMSVSLEGREPLLDHRLQEYAARLPRYLKLNGSVGKAILKDIVHDHVPEEIMSRPKMGFSMPIGTWMSRDLKPLVQHYLDPVRIRSQGIYNPQWTSRHTKLLFSGRHANVQGLWAVLMFQLWHERWMES